jgi:hypothetical protein
MKIQQIKSWVYSHKILTGFLVFIFLIIIMPGTPSEKKVSDTNKETKTETKQEIKMVFDVPSYYNKDISEMEKFLGEPIKDTAIKQKEMGLDFDTAELEFEKENYELLVEYNIKTNKAIGFFISKNGDMLKKDKEILAKIANVSFENKTYTAEYVPVINDSSKFTGLNIYFKQTQIEEWDKLVENGKKAKVIYKDTKVIGDTEFYELYVDTGWYYLKVDQKKNLVSKFSQVKQKITGYKNIKFKDSNTGGIIAEVTSFSGSIEIYK